MSSVTSSKVPHAGVQLALTEFNTSHASASVKVIGIEVHVYVHTSQGESRLSLFISVVSVSIGVALHLSSITEILFIVTFQVFLRVNSYATVSPVSAGIDFASFVISHLGVGPTGVDISSVASTRAPLKAVPFALTEFNTIHASASI